VERSKKSEEQRRWEMRESSVGDVNRVMERAEKASRAAPQRYQQEEEGHMVWYRTQNREGTGRGGHLNRDGT